MDLRSYHVRAQTSKGNILFNGEFLPNGMYVLKNYSGVIEVRFSPGRFLRPERHIAEGQSQQRSEADALRPPAAFLFEIRQ